MTDGQRTTTLTRFKNVSTILIVWCSFAAGCVIALWLAATTALPPLVLALIWIGSAPLAYGFSAPTAWVTSRAIRQRYKIAGIGILAIACVFLLLR